MSNKYGFAGGTAHKVIMVVAALGAVLVLLTACRANNNNANDNNNGIRTVALSVSSALTDINEATVTVTATNPRQFGSQPLALTVSLTLEASSATSPAGKSLTLTMVAPSASAIFSDLEAGTWTVSVSTTSNATTITTTGDASIKILIALELNSPQTGSGDDSFVITITDPITEVYAISIVDSGTDGNSSAITLTAMRPNLAADNPRRNQSSRLRQGAPAGVFHPRRSHQRQLRQRQRMAVSARRRWRRPAIRPACELCHQQLHNSQQQQHLRKPLNPKHENAQLPRFWWQ